MRGQVGVLVIDSHRVCGGYQSNVKFVCQNFLVYINFAHSLRYQNLWNANWQSEYETGSCGM